VSWTAKGPLFDRTTIFRWGVRVIGQPKALLSGAFTVTDAAREYPLHRTNLDIPVQYSGLRITDLDGDGHNEMLVGSAQAVYVLSYSGSTYQQSWVYPFNIGAPDPADGNDVEAVTSADIDGDGKQEIYFSKGGALVRLDGVSRREVVHAQLRCEGLEIADLDGDGTRELACLNVTRGTQAETQRQVLVLNASTLAKLWSTPQLDAGFSMAIANVDEDAALEIVTAGGYVYDGGTHELQWNYGQPFGWTVDTGDMDGDGTREIVAAGYLVGAIRAYSAVSQSKLWEYVSSTEVADLTVADANGDGLPEVIAGDFAEAPVMAVGYDTTTQQPELLWQIDAQERGVNSIRVGDVDGDGSNEIVWGAGATETGRKQLVIAGFTPAIGVKWQSGNFPQLGGQIYGGQLARIGAGATRVMFSAPGRFIALTPMTDEMEISTEPGFDGPGAAAPAVVDYDHDDIDELFFGRSPGFSVYDFAARSIEWQAPWQINSAQPFSVKQADMNGDGHADLIGLDAAGQVEVDDVHAQTQLWRSEPLNDGSRGLAVSDLDNDGEQEIVVATSGRIVIYGRGSTGTTYVERASVRHDNSIVALVAADLDGDSKPEIYVLNEWAFTSFLETYDANLQLVRSVQLDNESSALFVEQSAFARKNLVLAGNPYLKGGNPQLWVIDPVTGTTIWHSPPLLGTVSTDSLQFVDVDGDGVYEMTFGSYYGLYVTR
jgi:hypothetical protein